MSKRTRQKKKKRNVKGDKHAMMSLHLVSKDAAAGYDDDIDILLPFSLSLSLSFFLSSSHSLVAENVNLKILDMFEQGLTI